MIRRTSVVSAPQRGLSAILLLIGTLTLPGCGLALPEVKPMELEQFDLSTIPTASLPPRPSGQQITGYAVEYVTDLGIPDGQPGHDSEVRVVLPSRMHSGKVPALVVNGAGAYLFSGMVLSDEDIEPMLPYVEHGYAIIAYETDGCQPSFDHDPTASEIAEMTRHYVASKAGLINAERALSYALDRFPEIDADQLYAIGHSSGGKQALLLSSHDERIRGCVAFAPACQMDFGSKMTVARIGGPDGSHLSREVLRSMPLVHAKVTKTPMLLVYSPNDRITRPAEVLTYAKAVGKVATAIPVRCDGHGAVPDAGLQLALAWLHAQRKKSLGDAGTANLVSFPAGETSDASPVESPMSTEAPTSTEASEPAELVPQRIPVPSQGVPSPFKSDLPQGIRHNPFASS